MYVNDYVMYVMIMLTFTKFDIVLLYLLISCSEGSSQWDHHILWSLTSKIWKSISISICIMLSCLFMRLCTGPFYTKIVTFIMMNLRTST